MEAISDDLDEGIDGGGEKRDWLRWVHPVEYLCLRDLRERYRYAMPVNVVMLGPSRPLHHTMGWNGLGA